MAGMFVPATPGETGEMRIIDVDFTLELVIVVLLPVRAEFPKKPEGRPAEVRVVPEPSQLTIPFDISTYANYF